MNNHQQEVHDEHEPGRLKAGFLTGRESAHVRARATAVIEYVYENRRPLPLARRQDAEALARRCLLAGWLDAEVQAAMMAVASITWIQVEGELRRRADQCPPFARSPEAPTPEAVVCRWCANTGRISRNGQLWNCDHQGGTS